MVSLLYLNVPHADLQPDTTIIHSPNADEALSLLSIQGPPTPSLIEQACQQFLDLGVGPDGTGTVIIRSGHLGAYVKSRKTKGQWIPAYWGEEDAEKVVDVTGQYQSSLHIFLPNMTEPCYYRCWKHIFRWIGRWVVLYQWRCV